MTTVHETASRSVDLLSPDPIFAAPVVYAGSRAEVPLGAEAESLDHHRYKRGTTMIGGEDFAAALSGTGLTGRGGAHIPASWKLAAAAESGPGGTVVVNGAEGEPGSAKDAAVLQLRPHLVLDGALAVAEAIDAAEVVLWVHESATATRGRLADAVRERRGQLPMPVRLLLAPEGYVGGEASAVISGVRGKPVLPAHSRDRARPWGEGPAVLVHNAETHARLGLLSLGQDPVQTSIVTIAESSSPLNFTRRTVVEVSRHESFASILGGVGVPAPAAVLLGGMGGTWVRWADLANLVVDPDDLRNRGLSLGAGIVHLLPKGRDGLAESAAIADRLARESARQCGPCVFGLPALAKTLTSQARKSRSKRASDSAGVTRLADLIAGRGACRHPDGALRMALSAQEVFAS